MAVVFLALCVGLHAQDEPETAAGPFLRVTALPSAQDGIVFRLGWAHPYRPGGSHPPVAAGHLSRVFTPAPVPVPKASQPVPVEEEEEETSELKEMDDVDITTLEDGGDGLSIDVDDFEEPKKEPEKKEEQHHHGHHEAPKPKAPARPDTLLFYHPAGYWDTAEAMNPTNRLKAGEPSMLLNLDPFLPRPSRPPPRALPADEAAILYIRAFQGPKLRPAPVPVRLELYRNNDDTEPVADIEMTAGFFGIRLTRPRGDQPVFETWQALRERWYAETRKIIADRSGREFYVTTNAPTSGSGRRDEPVDLQTALSSKKIRGGDTIWLHGGIYEAPGHPHPRPLPEVKPKVEPLKPEDMPKLDSTMGADEGPEEDDELDLMLDDALGEETPALKKKREEEKPDTVMLYYFRSVLTGEPGNPVIVRVMPGHKVVLRGGMRIHGAHTWYWGFEIGEPEERANSRELSSLVDVNSPGSRLVNLHMYGHIRGPIITAATPADAEMYGCIVHDQGYWPKTSRYREGFTPPPGIGATALGGVLRITDNIVFGGYGYNVMGPMWSESMHNLVVEGNILFSAGMKQPDWQTANLALLWHTPFWRYFVTDNVLYQPHTGADNFLSVAYSPLLGWDCGELVFRDNALFGGYRCMEMGAWSHMRVTGNTIASGKRLVNIFPRRTPPDGTVWDDNTYVSERGPADTNMPRMLSYHGLGRSFEGWRKVKGFDANSRFIADPSKVGPKVVVRPNLYEAGRAHVAVAGWGNEQAVSVDLGAVLENGRKFMVCNVEAMDTPVVEGVFDGTPVQFPRLDTFLTPDFDAYLVRIVH